MKRLKDPIYGYIEIDETIMTNVVDTAEFQRLRNIIQTSYSPVYSSAVHNRFVHSLGVYHLGRMVSVSLQNDLPENIDLEGYGRWFELFEMACLLHDVGHAPFSHTGEMYYLSQGNREELHKEIISLIDDNDLEQEIRNFNYKAAPHELMSIIVSLKIFDSFFNTKEEKSFFARCISGYFYSEKSLHYTFLNCLISLLKSSVIDVDRLDYLVRDAYITGFNTVMIDYERLLKNIRVRKKDEQFNIIYKKGAISVIENVVYAHDAQRKWIQNHS